MRLLLAAAVGVMAGVHTATWGMYKDAPHEGFSAGSTPGASCSPR